MSDEAEKKWPKLLEEIINKFTKVDFEGTPLYIKHFSFKDQREVDAFGETIYAKARANGLPTEQEALDFLASEGLWTSSDSLELSQQKEYVEKLEGTLSNLVLNKQIKEVESQLKDERQKLHELKKQKNDLLRDTCENYTKNKVSNEMLYYSFYKDKELTQRYIGKEDFDHLRHSELAALTVIYNDAMKHLVIDDIKQLALEPIFVNYYNIYSDAIHNIFEDHVFDWSFYQVNLVNYAKIFRNILENVQNIPDHVKKDPEMLLDYASGDSHRRKIMDKSRKADSYSLVGATQQDLNQLDLRNEGAKSLTQHIKDKGGDLNMSDFAELFGK
jgi:hypothetical protein